jgi:hypothetical protein
MAKQQKNIRNSGVELAEAYYLENFLKVLGFVNSTYNDILNKRELRFIEKFEGLSENAQRLYIRLALRSKVLFREDKLDYTEISVKAAAKELCENKILSINPSLHFEDYSDIFTVKELIKFGKSLGIDSLKGNRDLILELLSDHDEELFELITSEFQLYFLLEQEIVDKFLFLFFGNLYEDLSHFILEDLGVRKYEKIQIDRSSRLFQTKSQVRVALELGHLHSELWVSVENDDESEVELITNSLNSLRCPQILKGKLSKSLNLAGRFYERKKQYSLALSLYSKSLIPPARERSARILEKKGEYELAMNICKLIKKRPASIDELNFAASFSEVLKRKQGLAYDKRRKSAELAEQQLPLVWDAQGRVEEQVLSYLTKSLGVKGFHCENDYWCVLACLLFWEEFWQSGPGVFYHPFVSEPRDFRSGEFFIRQEKAIRERASFWENSKGSFCSNVLSLYDQKNGTYCSLANWKRVERCNLELLLKHTPVDVCLKICLQILKNPKEFRSGLPDLFLSDHEGFLLGEVKSPRDQIQNSQKRWFKFFNNENIPYVIYRVPQ